MKAIIRNFTLTVAIFAMIVSFGLGDSVIAAQTHFLLDGKELLIEDAFVEHGRTYIPVRTVTELLGASLDWNSKTREVILHKEDIKVRFFVDEKKVIFNEQIVFMDAPLKVRDGSTYAPVRFVAEVLRYKVFWDADNNAISIVKKAYYTVKSGDSLETIAEKKGISVEDLLRFNSLSGEEIPQVGQKLYLESLELTAIDELKTKAVIQYADEELEWLARIIYTEAMDEPYDGLVAVGAVVVNRVKSANFPNTIYDVIFQKSQFTPAMSGKIYKVVPDADSYQAAEEALMGIDPTFGALYFYNPKISNSTFFQQKQHLINIGNHSFYY